MRKECQQHKVSIWSGLQDNVWKRSFHTYSSIILMTIMYVVRFRKLGMKQGSLFLVLMESSPMTTNWILIYPWFRMNRNRKTELVYGLRKNPPCPFWKTLLQSSCQCHEVHQWPWITSEEPLSNLWNLTSALSSVLEDNLEGVVVIETEMEGFLVLF